MMAGQWISLVCALIALAGLYLLLRPMPGSSALAASELPPLHDGSGRAAPGGDSKQAVGQSGD